MASYQAYLEPLDYVWSSNRTMAIMKQASIAGYLRIQRRALTKFFREMASCYTYRWPRLPLINPREKTAPRHLPIR